MPVLLDGCARDPIVRLPLPGKASCFCLRQSEHGARCDRQQRCTSQNGRPTPLPAFASTASRCGGKVAIRTERTQRCRAVECAFAAFADETPSSSLNIKAAPRFISPVRPGLRGRRPGEPEVAPAVDARALSALHACTTLVIGSRSVQVARLLMRRYGVNGTLPIITLGASRPWVNASRCVSHAICARR